MKLKNDYVLQDVAGSTVAMPADGDMNMMITLNGTGRFLWERLTEETSREALIQAIRDTYGVDLPTAEICVDNFVAELEKNDLVG